MPKTTFADYWWTILIRGIVAVLFAVIALFWPGFTLELLILLFALYVLIDGILAIISAIKAAEHHKQWWLFLLEGIVGLTVGILTLIWPQITAVILVYLIAAWAIITGIFEMWAAFVAPFNTGNKVLLGIVGLLSVLIGMILVIHPFEGVIALVWIIGLYAFIVGILFIAFSFQVKNLE